MKKTKKRNCKHGLDEKQEIQARRIKDVLIGEKTEKKEEYHEKLRDIYHQWCKENNYKGLNDTYFAEYLKEKDIVLYSAYVRAKYTIMAFI